MRALLYGLCVCVKVNGALGFMTHFGGDGSIGQFNHDDDDDDDHHDDFHGDRSMKASGESKVRCKNIGDSIF